MSANPFAAFRSEVLTQTPLRAAITAAYRRPEPECVPPLLDLAALAPDQAARVEALARSLVAKLRAKTRSSGVEGLIHEYSLSSQEGVALMCLAEALLRIPDAATRDALIRDKLSPGDWRAHVGNSPSLFVNAATWGLVLTGRLVATNSEQTLSAALTGLIARSGEPIIRAGVDVAMRLMGEQFVTGRTIEEAINASREREARGFTFSYDMLGEAATTAEDAARYLSEYERAVHAIGKASHKRGIYEGPGVSIKLSALHPRFQRIKRARVMSELLPRIKHLAALAKSHDIGLNIDAEEADRLDLSLDLLEALCLDPELSGWNGLGFVVQAYGKRCVFVVDWLIDLARRSKRRLMVRLTKGAYWDSEIKRAQVDGLEGFPVFTRKVHTDVSYLASARKLLAAPDAIYPQFATHNAQTLASVLTMAGPNFYRGPIRVPVPARHGRAALRGSGRPRQARPPLPRLCAGRLARDAARLFRAPPPGKRRQHLVRQPHRRRERAGRRTRRRSGRDRAQDPARRRAARKNRPAARSLRRRSASTRAGSIFPTSSGSPNSRTGWKRARGSPRRAFPPGAAPDEKGEPVRNPADHADVVGHTRHARSDEVDAAIGAAARGRARHGRRRRRTSGPRFCAAPRTSSRR